MKQVRKKWTGCSIDPQAPDLVLSRAVNWVPDPQRKYSTINGYEPNNITAAVAWTKIPPDLIASNAFIYRDLRSKLWVQAVGYPLIPREKSRDWIDLQMSNGAQGFWTNQYAVQRLPQRSYTQIETPRKSVDPITYIELLGQQNKFMVNDINLLELNPRGRPKDCEITSGPILRKTYDKRNLGIFHIRSNSKFLQTPKGVYASISSASADMDMTFSGLKYHLTKNTPGYRYITQDEYLLRSQELNKNSTTE
jgi:hypothetical protein